MKISIKKAWILLLSCLILVSIAYFDYFTGELGFFIFYFIPIILLSWHLGRWYGVTMSIASSVCWFMADYYCGYRYSNFAVAVWDTLVIRGGAFIIAAFAISKLHDSMEKQMKMGYELNTALSHLKQLKSILPICGNCKEKNKGDCYLDQIESYLGRHSDSRPPSRAAPECISKNYPELWTDIQKELEKRKDS